MRYVLRFFLLFLVSFPLIASDGFQETNSLFAKNNGNQASSSQPRLKATVSPKDDKTSPSSLSSPPKEQTLFEQSKSRGTYLKATDCPTDSEGYTVNFENIAVIQLIHFISKISGRNYIFNSQDLQFSVSIVSQDPTSVDNLTAALLQILKMNNLSVIEQGNNVLIYANQNLSRVSTIITDTNLKDACDAAIITRVFYLYNLDPDTIVGIVKPLVSTDAIVEVSKETRHLIVSDMTANVDKIADLLTALDTPGSASAIDIAEYDVKNGSPAALVAYAKEILAPFLSENNLQMIAQPSQNKIFIVSTPFLIQKALQILSSLDHADISDMMDMDLPPTAIEKNVFEMYKLQYQNGSLIADALRNIGVNLRYAGVVNPDFLNAIYTTQWLPINNSIVITGTSEAVEKVLGLVKELDTEPKQVFIEVLVIDTTLANSLDFGVQWIALGDEQNKLAYASGLLNNVPPSPNLQGGPFTTPGARYVASNPASDPPAIPNPGRDVALPQPSQLGGFTEINTNYVSSFGLGFIGNIIRHNGKSFLTLGALLSALDEELNTSIVLNPRIMVEDNQVADIFVGENIPYQTTSTVVQQTGSVTQNIQYEDIGVHLRVLPTISPDNMVTLQIDQSIISLLSQTTQNLIAPQTQKTLSSTRVHVPDGTFLVMSGHIRDDSTCIRSGIPCLGTLPLVGPAFSRSVNARQKRNLIFFVRPKVVSNIYEGLQLTNQEGYDYNWESHPSAIIDCGLERAPECETWPPPLCPDH